MFAFLLLWILLLCSAPELALVPLLPLLLLLPLPLLLLVFRVVLTAIVIILDHKDHHPLQLRDLMQTPS